MTHRGRNVNAEVSTSFDVRGVARFALLGLALLVDPTNGRAAEKTSEPFLAPATPASAAENLKVESRVLTALRKDERLRSFSLCVNVTNGVARVSGSVSSVALKKHAIEIVEKVAGVLKVESGDLYLAKVPQRPKPLSLPLEGDTPTQTRSASPNLQSDSVDTLTARDPLPPARAKPPPPAPQRVTLMAPEAVAVPPRTAESSRLTANPRPSPPVSSLPAALERLRQRDARFRKIRTEVRGPTVRVFSGGDAGEAVMAFAQAIRRLPGVQRVVIQDTSARPR